MLLWTTSMEEVIIHSKISGLGQEPCIEKGKRYKGTSVTETVRDPSIVIFESNLVRISL